MSSQRRTSIVVTVMATITLYTGFAALIAADSGYPALSKLLLPVGRGLIDFLYAATVAVVVYVSYRLLGSVTGFRSRRIARKAPEAGQVRREALLSANFALAGGLQAVAYLALAQLGLLKIYPSISERGWPYSIFSVVLFLVLSDAWFYLCHRVYHRSRFVFRHIHAVHHLSVVTTPMTNSQISPWELLPSAFFAVGYLMLVPMAMPMLSLMVIGASVYLILLHSGYEIFPRGTAEHWLGRWLVTPTYHQMHHELVTKNMGLYFTWWDRAFGSFSGQYVRRFDGVTAPSSGADHR